MTRVYAIIAAAGSSTRMGQETPKVLLPLHGATVLERAITPFKFLNIPVVILAPSLLIEQVRSVVQENSQLTIIPGGATRGESVSLGLECITRNHAPAAGDIVMIHDAARCLLSPETVQSLIDATILHGAVVPGLPVNDTLKRVREKGVITETVDRSELYSVQTPQCFRYELICRAYANGIRDATDDAALVEQFCPVTVVSGQVDNIKITRPGDIELAQALLQLRETARVR